MTSPWKSLSWNNVRRKIRMTMRRAYVYSWRVLLDLDGTVAQNAGRRLLARDQRIPISEEQYGESLLETLGWTGEQFRAWWHENQEEIYHEAEVLPGAAEAVRTLKAQGAHIAVVTARRASAEAVTSQWLQRHGFPFDQMIFSADDKVAVARELALNIGFEDDPFNATALAEVMPMVLVENFKNRSVVIAHPQVHRVAGWHEVHPLLGRLAAGQAAQASAPILAD
jgi:uncharacterized HAD superfamily protein